MTFTEITTAITASIAAFGLIGGFIGSIIGRLSKLEANDKVCYQKHIEHDRKFNRQEEINIKVEENHVEVMQALAGISSDIKHLQK